MISMVKNAVKSALVQRKIEEYNARLDEQFVSYDAWIREREEATENEHYKPSDNPAGATLQMTEAVKAQKAFKVQVIEYKDCGSSFVLPVPGLQEAVSFDADTSKINCNDSFVLFVNRKEFLTERATQIVSEYFTAHPKCVLVYGDEDEWNSNRSVRMNPWFKPDFSPDTLLSYFYYGNVVAVRADALQKVVWKASDDCLMNLYDMCLQLSFPVDREAIGHVQYVLYHGDSLKQLCIEDTYAALRKQYAVEACKKQQKSEDSASATSSSESNDKAEGHGNKISVVIPSKDHPGVLEVCLQSLVNIEKNENYEIVVVDNGSAPGKKKRYEELKNKFGFNYIYEPMEFNFSRMCNLGAEAATGNVLLFLNDDIEALEEGWMSKMLAHAMKSHVGAVGAKLYYPNSKTIQHAGITNLRLGPVHKMQFLEDTRSYYDGRNRFDSNVIAVTAACLMVRKEVFDDCGGFGEGLAVAFNDVELCFRIYKNGYYNVQCNGAVLCHHESLSRGNDETIEKQIRLQNERRKMYAVHSDLYGVDPFYHPYMNTQILDTNYSFAYEYPAGEAIDVCEPKLLKGGLQQEWYNECLLISMEYAADLTAWLEHPDSKGNELYFQGYQFVIGSDNACFKRSILLKNVDKEEVWEIPCGENFRPDLNVNVPEGNVSLCGFALVIEKSSLPAGKYQVGCMATSLVGRQRLCRFVNKFVEI